MKRKYDYAVPRQTKCPECGETVDTRADLWIDWEGGEYEFYCEQCGFTGMLQMKKWEHK